MKRKIKYQLKYILQKILGFPNYLKAFSIFKIYTLKRDKNEGDFFCFLNLLPENGYIIDAGANIGIMTWHLAKKRPNSLVYSYEPIPINNLTIRFIKKKFNLINCIVRQKALSDQPHTLTMILPEVSLVQEQGLSHVVNGKINSDSPRLSENKGKLYEVESITLDQTFYENKPELALSDNVSKSEHSSLIAIQKKLTQVTGIKIDVENYEWFVLNGAKKILEYHSPIVYCELWPNEERTRCIELMESLDYSMFVALDEQHFTLFVPEKHNKHNFLFIPNKKIPELRHLIR